MADDLALTMRWFGPDDLVSLQSIRQVTGVSGIVTALYHVPAGEVWSLAELRALRDRIRAAGLRFEVVESIPVHEDIKLGRQGSDAYDAVLGPGNRDRYIDTYCESIQHLGQVGVPVLCYNFMGIFDWTRTNLAKPHADGSTSLSYDHADMAAIDLSRGTGSLPGWFGRYSAEELRALLAAYRTLDAERLWDNLGYFLHRVVPAARDAGVVMGIHPDDPPWPIVEGLPRIITNESALERLLGLVDARENGLTFCTGSLGVDPQNDLPAMVRRFGGMGRIHFAHCRNIRRTAAKCFEESPHADGDLDLVEVMAAYHDIGYHGPMRSDHGRNIWGEDGRPGYGLYDHALGTQFLWGAWKGLGRRRE